MSLLTVHKVMVATAILFCAGFAVREVILLASGGGFVSAFLGLVSAAGAVVLAFYLRWLLRTKGRSLEAASRRPPRDN
jgi:hypothetical protein